MYCQKCGTELPNDAVFCGKCGSKQELLIDTKGYVPNENKMHSDKVEGRDRIPFIAIISAVAIILVVILIIVVVMIKNKNKNEDYASEQLEESVVYSQHQNNQSNSTDKDEDKEINKDTSEKENGQTDKSYPASSDWSEFSIEDDAIQIDDKIYAPGISVEELLSLIESSDAEYECECNKDKIIPGNGSDAFSVYKNGADWFDCYIENPSKETLSLEKCQLMYLILSNEAKEHSYYFNGISYSDILNMTYDDVKKLGENTFKEYEYTEKQDDNNCLAVVYRNHNKVPLERSKWAGYALSGDRSIIFYIDQDTGKVVNVEENPNRTRICVSEGSISDLSDLSKEELETLTEKSRKILEEHMSGSPFGVEPFDDANVLEQHLDEGGYRDVRLYCFNTLFELTGEDGHHGYVYLELSNIYRGYDGIEYDNYSIGHEWDHDPRQ